MAATTVTVINSTGLGIWLAVSRVEDACRRFCPEDPFATLGWFRLIGGVHTLLNPTGNRFWYFYAERDDGVIYAGPFPGDEVHPFDRFFKCSCNRVGSPFITVGFSELDLNAAGAIQFT